ncbi:MAG: hypothetical protein AB7S77_07310 [Desulfatirhabdiaceae bacterium]
MSVQSQGGRPRKFEESSRVVTVTLPERTLKNLESIDTDRAKAIVKAVDRTLSHTAESSKEIVDLVEVASNTAIIVVGPSASLRSISWLRLVEIAPERFLIVIPRGTRAEKLELTILDLLDTLSSDDQYERSLLEELRRLIRSLRHSNRIEQSEIMMISMKESKKKQN